MLICVTFFFNKYIGQRGENSNSLINSALSNKIEYNMRLQVYVCPNQIHELAINKMMRTS